MAIDNPVSNKIIAILEDLVFFGEVLIAYCDMVRLAKSIIHLAMKTKCQIIALHCEIIKESFVRVIFVPMIVRPVFTGIWRILPVEGILHFVP